MTFAIALASLIVSVAVLVLTFVAPRTKSKKDDALLDGAKAVKAKLDDMTGDAK